MRRKSISRAFSAGTLLIMSASMVATLLMPLVAYAKGPPKPTIVSPVMNANDVIENPTFEASACPTCVARYWSVFNTALGTLAWSGTVSGNGTTIVGDATAGTFTGSLFGKTAFENSTNYYVHLADSDGSQGPNSDDTYFTIVAKGPPVPEMSTWIAIVTVVTGFGLMYKFSPALRPKFDRA